MEHQLLCGWSSFPSLVLSPFRGAFGCGECELSVLPLLVCSQCSLNEWPERYLLHSPITSCLGFYVTWLCSNTPFSAAKLSPNACSFFAHPIQSLLSTCALISFFLWCLTPVPSEEILTLEVQMVFFWQVSYWLLPGLVSPKVNSPRTGPAMGLKCMCPWCWLSHTFSSASVCHCLRLLSAILFADKLYHSISK